MTTENKDLEKEIRTPESKLNAEVSQIRDSLDNATTYEGASAKVADGWFKTTLPEGLTQEHFEGMSKHLSNTMAAVKLSHGVKSLDMMHSDPELKRTHLSVPLFGKDTIDTSFVREQVIGGNTIHGVSKTSLEMYGESPTGQMRIVKDILAAKSKDILGKL